MAFDVGGAGRRLRSPEIRRYPTRSQLRCAAAIRTSPAPIGLRDRFIRRQERKQDEAIHLALVLARGDTIRIEAAFGIHRDVGDLAADLCTQVGRYRLEQRANAGPAPRAGATNWSPPPPAQRRHRSHPRHNYSAHLLSSLDLCANVSDVAAPTRIGELPCHRICPDSRQNGRHRGRDKTVRLMNDITTGDAVDGVLNKNGTISPQAERTESPFLIKSC